MSYGFLATNDNSQILVSSETRNLHFIGKASYQTTLKTSNSYGGTRQWTYRIGIVINVTPLPFFTMPDSSKYAISAVRQLITPPSILFTTNSISIVGNPVKTFIWGDVPVSITEGTTSTFNISTTNVINGTILYWSIDNTNNDFQAITGSCTINNNSGSFQVSPTLYKDFFPESAEAYTVSVRTYNPTTGSVVLSKTFTVIDSNNSSSIVAFGWETGTEWGTSTITEGVNAGPFIVSSTDSGNIIYATSEVCTIIGDGFVVVRGIPSVTFQSTPTSADITAGAGSAAGGILIEGGSVIIDVLTYNILNGTKMYWEIVALGKGGPTKPQTVYLDGIASTEISTNDFVARSGSLTAINGNGSFVLQSIRVNEASMKEVKYEYFTINIRRDVELTGPIIGTLNIQVLDQPLTIDQYPIWGDPGINDRGVIGNIVEGSTTNIFYVYNGYGYYWTINHITTSASDFTAVSGQITQQYKTSYTGYPANTGYFYVYPVSDGVYEGLERYTISIRSGSPTGPIIQTSGELRLTDLSTVPPAPSPPSVVFNKTTVAEDTTILCTATLSSPFSIGTQLYWKINHITSSKNDFSADNGILYFSAGSTTATFNITPTYTSKYTIVETDESFTVSLISQAAYNYMYWTINHITTNNSDFAAVSGICVPAGYNYWNFYVSSILDESTEGTEKFTISLRQGSITAPILVTSGEISITDTSISRTYATLSNTIIEGNTLIITLYTPNVTTGTKLYWDINHITTNDSDFVNVNGEFISSANGAQIIVVATADSIVELDESFSINVRSTLKYQWEVELISNSTSNIIPEVYVFADARASMLPPTETSGLIVYMDDGSIAFDSRRKPLTIPAAASVTFPTGALINAPSGLIGKQGGSMYAPSGDAAFTPTKESSVYINGTLPNKPIYFIQSLAQTEEEGYAQQSESYTIAYGLKTVYILWQSKYWAFYRGGIRRSGNNLYAGWITISVGVSQARLENSDLFGLINLGGYDSISTNNPLSNETINLSASSVLISDGFLYD